MTKSKNFLTGKRIIHINSNIKDGFGEWFKVTKIYFWDEVFKNWEFGGFVR